jgi:hypothetical protein
MSKVVIVIEAEIPPALSPPSQIRRKELNAAVSSLVRTLRDYDYEATVSVTLGKAIR